jgi:hypothetical protein
VAIVRFKEAFLDRRVGKRGRRTWVLCCTLVITMGLMASFRSSSILNATALASGSFRGWVRRGETLLTPGASYRSVGLVVRTGVAESRRWWNDRKG